VQKIARIYLRVSTEEQDLERQERIVKDAQSANYYIAGVYRERSSGARADRPELLRMISDLQPGDIVIAEKMDRISRLPLDDAECLIQTIRSKGARLAVPGVIDLSDLVTDADGVTKVVLESVQDMLLKLALQMARDDYENRRDRQKQGIELAKAKGKYRGRRPNTAQHELILKLRPYNTIEQTAQLAGCSISQVKRICAMNKKKPD